MDTKSITEILNKHNIKPSYARIKIYKYLDDYKSHPTVDEIYNCLIEEIPTLSKTTVYNSLNLFEDKDLVHSLSMDNLEKRYELSSGDHIHFKCQVCKNIYDLPFREEEILPEGYEDYKINERHIFLKGICKNCNK